MPVRARAFALARIREASGRIPGMASKTTEAGSDGPLAVPDRNTAIGL